VKGGILYAIRLKANNRLQEEIEHLTVRPVGRPPAKPKVFYYDFSYRAGSWDRSRRVIARVERHRGDLSPPHRFHRHQLERRGKKRGRFYNQRGRCENSA